MRHEYKKIALMVLVMISAELCLYMAPRLPYRRLQVPSQTQPTIDGLAPSICLQDVHGHWHNLKDLHGDTVVIVFFCGCKACQQVNERLVSMKRQHSSVAILGITAMSPADAREYVVRHNLNFTVLLDPFSRVSTLWSSSRCPSCWIVDPTEKLKYGSLPGESVSSILTTIGIYLSS